MAQRKFRASVSNSENVVSFHRSAVTDRGATALELVYQAAVPKTNWNALPELWRKSSRAWKPSKIGDGRGVSRAPPNPKCANQALALIEESLYRLNAR